MTQTPKETKPICSCGSKVYYVKVRVWGWTEMYYDFNGEGTIENTEFIDPLNVVYKKTKYCGYCHKRIRRKLNDTNN